MTTTVTICPHLLIENLSGAILLENGDFLSLETGCYDASQGVYSPPVWQVKGSVDKVPMIPRIHWRKFR